ncbi:hypothetical protein ONZ45_g1933 [Pleurotus djamor]|nr:hypothetical protein ONZ45_g1933 [Pleurotus djamor]
MPKANPSRIKSEMKPKFRAIARVHFHELEIIWPLDPRIPTAASRKAWSLARNISPDRVNAWWYNRKRVAKRLRIKIPKEEYELPVGEPPVVEEDIVKHEDLTTDVLAGSLVVGDNSARSRGSKKLRKKKILKETQPRRRSRSAESLDIPLADICAQKRTSTVKIEPNADDNLGALLSYASSDTAYSPPPYSGVTDGKDVYIPAKLYLDDMWPSTTDSDLVSSELNPSDQPDADDAPCAPVPPSGDLSQPDIVLSAQESSVVAAEPICSQGLSTTSSFTCPLCCDLDYEDSLLAGVDWNSLVDSIVAVSGRSSWCSTGTQTQDHLADSARFDDGVPDPLGVAQRSFLSLPISFAFGTYISMDGRYYTCDGWLLSGCP